MVYLKRFWNAVTTAKNFTTNVLFLLIVIFILVVLFTAEAVTVPESGALVLNPTGTIVEQKRAIDPFTRLTSGNQDEEPESLLRDILKALDAAAGDKRIKAVVLDLHGLNGAPVSMLEEIGKAIDTFKESGKPVYAFGSGYTQTQYYVASHADHVYIDKHAFQSLGGVFLTGLGIYPMYFKSALDKLRIRFHIFRAGKFKSAVEPYLRDNMSDDTREANLAWLGDLWSQYADTVVEQRGITREEFDRYANQYDVLLGQADNDPSTLAVQEGLVDELVSRPEFETRLKAIVGEADSGFNQVGYRDYLRITQPPIPLVNPSADKIAVITAKGTIMDGEQPAGDIGGESVARLIKTARNDDSVKALVLRIDSPGGSASAAERIRSELELTQQQGKPVVVSMSGYAASGGYWVSATANKIFAQETTVTGSIGTFIMFPTFEESLGELGVYTDGVGTTALSGALDPFLPMNPILERTLEKTLGHTYERFITLVARGRDMSPEEVDKIAQGRVWSGKAAVRLGLVDAIGDTQDAIDSAALLADVKDYDVLYMEKALSTRERLFNQLIESSVQAIGNLSGDLGIRLPIIGRLSGEMLTLLNMSRSPGIYLQCLYCTLRP